MNPATWLLRILLFFFLSHFSLSADTLTQHHFVKDNDEIPGNIVVWVANRGNPIKDNSGILSIDPRGNLALFQSNQTLPVWSANISMAGTRNTIAQILDSGNLVLLQNNTKKAVLWQSFDYPTNIWISFQSLEVNVRTGLNRVYTSWKSPEDPGVRNYSFRMNPNRFPQMFLYQGSTPLWRSGTWTGQRWNEQCDFYGHCGPNAYCKPDLAGDFECTCFPGFESKLPQAWSIRDGAGGCVRKSGISLCGIGDRFVKFPRVKVPDTSAAHVDMSVGLKQCKEKCLRNCSCMAYASAYSEIGRGIGCLTWHGDLVDARTYAHTGQDLYIRVDKNELARYTKKGLLQKKAVLAVIIVSLAVAFLILVALLHCFVRRQRRTRTRRSNNMFSFVTFEDSLGVKEIDESRRNGDLPLFHLSTIAAATNNFSSDNKLGQGGFGPVYKGVLLNGNEIAVKRLSKYSGQGVQEFKNEIMLIAKLQHRNLVSMLGCCIEGEEKMLIYEFLPNKSLDSIIFDESKRSVLDWKKRLEIICGIARVMLYLHQDYRLRVLHRDLKASNVLLDATLNPKILDFGMARIFGGDQTEGDTKRVVGTYGYMSPEYAMHGHFSMKSDVYSFGVLLLEIITSKKNISYIPYSPSLNLVGQVWELWKEDKAMEVVDSALGDSILKCIQIALLCVQEHAADRPTMSTDVSMLSNESTLPSPKQPAFVEKKIHNGDGRSISEGTSSVNSVTVTMIQAR
ncbi:hypothetical protein like AT1G11340 [Hibiscus trionum]|uniref:Receptor-like serine/threonine-protein kinase n=1 Tax=Hibiscus trionum TaxID=183268 RepID=A0A9W7H9C1_HIBTR|nr:hypothetical protein like AT1G11340 [Hibiscus trionum]